MPTDLTATPVSSTQIDLAWQAATDNVGVAGYNVYRDGAAVATGVPSTSFSDTTVAADTQYSYEVTAVDAAGNESARSEPAVATTLADTTDTAPAAPGNVQASKRGPAIRVTWTDNATDETGYRVYRTAEGVTLAWELAANSTEFRDRDVKSGVAYTYCVTAFAGSLESNAVCAAPVTMSGGSTTAEPAGNEALSLAEGTTVVTIDAVNLRVAPSRQAEVVTELAAGTVLTVTGPTETSEGLAWVPVATSDGTAGYVAAEFLAAA